MTMFEYGNDMVMIDAGLMFPDDEQPGIDLILPDYTYVLENEDKLRGIIITHGHEDHTGALPYLLQDLTHKVPIYSSKLTLGIIEGKLAEHNIKSPKFREVQDGSTITLGAFNITFFAMTHSIPAAFGVFMNTPAGNVMHTGDFKLDIAFTRLQTSLNIIAATPKDEKSQRTVMEFLQKRVFPCVAAVGFALGFSADSATVLEYLGYSPAQIESHESHKNPESPANDTPQVVQASDTHPETPQSNE